MINQNIETDKNYLIERRFNYAIIAFIIFKFIISSFFIYFAFDYLADNKFYNDAQRIYASYNKIYLYDNSVDSGLFSGYNNTALLFRIFLLNLDVTYEGLFLFSCFAYIFVFCLMVSKIKIRHYKTAFLCFLIFFIFDCIFLFQPTKEIVSLVVNLLVLTIIKSEKPNIYKYISISILLSAYALFFRIYYFIVLIIFLLLNLSARLDRKGKIRLWTAVLLAFTVIFYFTGLFDRAINLRSSSYKYLEGFTNTLIGDVIPQHSSNKNIAIFFVNYLVNLVRLAFPLEVLLKSFSRGIVYVPLQLFITIYILSFIIKVKSFSKAFLEAFKEKIAVDNAVFYVMSFFLTSVIFEPDFGSAFRHSMNVMPFLLYLIFEIPLKRAVELLQVNTLKFEQADSGHEEMHKAFPADDNIGLGKGYEQYS